MGKKTEEPVEQNFVNITAYIPVGEYTAIDLGAYTDVREINDTLSDGMSIKMENHSLNAIADNPYATGIVTLADNQSGDIIRVTINTIFAKNDIRVEFDVASNSLFRYAHDENLLTADELISSLKMRFLTSDGIASSWISINDLSVVDLQEQSPRTLYEEMQLPYCRTGADAIITATLPNGKQSQHNRAVGNILIARKGDADLNGTVNASDAANVLIYAAQVGAGATPSLLKGTDEELEQLARKLANVNEDASINASDAANILIYSAAQGAGKGEPDWNAILNGKTDSADQ